MGRKKDHDRWTARQQVASLRSRGVTVLRGEPLAAWCVLSARRSAEKSLRRDDAWKPSMTAVEVPDQSFRTSSRELPCLL